MLASDSSFVFLLPLVLTVALSIPIAGIIALGAYKMRRLELYPLAVIASVLAMLPCHPGFIIGLPIGLWSLVVLSRPEVKAAFRQRGAGTMTDSAKTDHSIDVRQRQCKEGQMTTGQLMLMAIALVLGGVAALLFVAGAPHFDMVPRTYANFAGIAVAIASGVFWVLFGLSCAGRKEE